MKTSLTCVLILLQLFVVHAEVRLEQLTENQSLVLSCSPQQQHDSLTGLQLYRRRAKSQITLLSMAEGCEPRVDQAGSGRLNLTGGLHSPQVIVTISNLEHSDTGLYIWEMNYKGNSSDRITLSPQQVLLLVDETEGRLCQCVPSYPPVLLAIFAAAGLLLLTLIWLAIEKCLKKRHHHVAQPPVPAPIYEEMTRKQQSSGFPQNNQEVLSHLEETSFPLYANPNIRQSQENYYACPRQLPLNA